MYFKKHKVVTSAFPSPALMALKSFDTTFIIQSTRYINFKHLIINIDTIQVKLFHEGGHGIRSCDWIGTRGSRSVSWTEEGDDNWDSSRSILLFDVRTLCVSEPSPFLGLELEFHNPRMNLYRQMRRLWIYFIKWSLCQEKREGTVGALDVILRARSNWQDVIALQSSKWGGTITCRIQNSYLHHIYWRGSSFTRDEFVAVDHKARCRGNCIFGSGCQEAPRGVSEV